MNPLPTLLNRVLPAFPCYQSKRPMTPNGFKDATANSREFAKLTEGLNDFLLGVPTGEITGFDVLDIDAAGLNWAKILPINLTREHVTPSGGLHLLFVHHPELRNSASKISRGVDVRADGGYIIWWPREELEVFRPEFLAPWPEEILAQLATSNYKEKPLVGDPNRQIKGYQEYELWYTYKECIELLKLDEELLNLVKEIEMRLYEDGRLGSPMPRLFTVSKYAREARWALQACAKSLVELGSTEAGSRNDTLNIKAYLFGRIMARRWTHHRRFIVSLLKGSIDNGLLHDDGPESVINTIVSGLRAGFRDPYPDLDTTHETE